MRERLIELLLASSTKVRDYIDENDYPTPEEVYSIRANYLNKQNCY